MPLTKTLLDNKLFGFTPPICQRAARLARDPPLKPAQPSHVCATTSDQLGAAICAGATGRVPVLRIQLRCDPRYCPQF